MRFTHTQRAVALAALVLVACSNEAGGPNTPEGSGAGGIGGGPTADGSSATGGTSSSDSGASDSGGTEPSGGSPGSDAGGSADTRCTDLNLTGAMVFVTKMPGERPKSSGGTLLDGTYDLVELRGYGPLTQAALTRKARRALRISAGGTRIEAVDESVSESEPAGETRRQAGRLSTRLYAGEHYLFIMEECPKSQNAGGIPFSVEGNGFVVHEVVDYGSETEGWILQVYRRR